MAENPYLALAQGLHGMMAQGNEKEAKAVYNQKKAYYGNQFDDNAFAEATKGVFGDNGYTVDQINQWGNQNDELYRDLAVGLQGMIGRGNDDEARRVYNEKKQTYGSRFDDNAFAKATAGLGNAGANGYTTQQISEWANPVVQSAQEKRQKELQDYNPYIPNRPSAPVAPTLPPAAIAPPPDVKMDDYQKNPYLDQMAGSITSQMNENFTRNLLPSTRSGAMVAGGFGGSRQGVIEANGLNDLNRSLGQSLTNLYGNDFTQDRQRALQKYQGDRNLGLQKYQADQGYALGRGGLEMQKYTADQGYGLGVANLGLNTVNSMNQNNQFNKNFGLQNDQFDAQIYQNNFNNSLNAGRFGLDTFNTMNGLNNQGINNSTTMQNAPLNYFNNTSANTATAAGTGTQNQIAPQGNPWMAGIGTGLSTYGAINNYLRTTTGP